MRLPTSDDIERISRTQDPGWDAMRLQILILGFERIDLTAVTAKGVSNGRVVHRTIDTSEFEDRGPEFQRLGQSGRNVFLRPASRGDGQAYPMAFIDDVDLATAREMTRDGLSFAILVESSPGNHHGWIRMTDQPMAPHLVAEANKELARRYKGDPASTDYRHGGRLAGTRNWKVERRLPDGQAPDVRLASASLGVAPQGPRLVGSLRVSRAIMSCPAQTRYDPPAAPHVTSCLPRPDAAAAFEEASRRFHKEDISRRDFSAAMSLAHQGYVEADIAWAISVASEDVRSRKSNVADYARRTARRAVEMVKYRSLR